VVPLFSAVMIFKDPPVSFFEEAIESILAQTREEWELIFVDDGTRDGSDAVARHFAAAHPERIRMLTHPGGENRGMSASRNLGIASARGEFVCFLDADDVWLPDKLERQHALLVAHPEVVATFSPALLWWSWDEKPASPDVVQTVVVPPGVVAPPSFVPLILAHPASSPTTGSVMIRRSHVAATCFENAFRSMHEDMVFWVKTASRHALHYAPDVVFKYRQHPRGSVVRAFADGSFAQARREFLTWAARYLADIGADRATRRAARVALRREFGLVAQAQKLARRIVRRLRRGLA